MTWRLTPCGQPRYLLKYRHHHWHVLRRTGGFVVSVGQLGGYDNLHEAHKAIEGDIAELNAAEMLAAANYLPRADRQRVEDATLGNLP